MRTGRRRWVTGPPVATSMDRLTPAGAPPAILVTGHLPLTWPPSQGDDCTGAVVLVSATEVAVLDLDLTC